VKAPTVVIVGTGDLARTICGSLAALKDVPLRVIVLGRNAGRAAEVARAAEPAGPVRVTAYPAGAGTAAHLAMAAAACRPEVVLQCASWHSPRDSAGPRSAWTALLAEAGFGITLPLQALPASLTAAALPPESAFINGCFPDAVNPVLAGLGLPVLCGVGNASTLWAQLADPGLKLVAHHIHLHRPGRAADEARAWQRSAPVPDLAARLSGLRALPRAAINERAGPPAARLVKHLLTGEVARMSVPGPLGLPGGYPVLIRGLRLELDLPSALPAPAAIAWNQRMSGLDGVTVHAHGRVTFAPHSASALARHLPGLAAGFDLDKLPAVAQQMRELRGRLRRTYEYPG